VLWARERRGFDGVVGSRHRVCREDNSAAGPGTASRAREGRGVHTVVGSERMTLLQA
jgi:hypothetical protein